MNDGKKNNDAMESTVKELEPCTPDMRIQENALYTPTLRREEEKAAMCFRKMEYSRPTYKGFLALWHYRWATDFKDCNRHGLLKQIQRGFLDGDADAVWRQRYNYYLHLFRKFGPRDLERLISSHRESGQFPSGFHKRLTALRLCVKMGTSKKKLGGYRLEQDYIDSDGKKRRKTIAGRQYDLSFDEVRSIVERMEADGE